MYVCVYAVHREEGTITRGWMHSLATGENTIRYHMQNHLGEVSICGYKHRVQAGKTTDEHAKDMSATRQYVCIWWRGPRTDIKQGIFISGLPVILLFPPLFSNSISLLFFQLCMHPEIKKMA